MPFWAGMLTEDQHPHEELQTAFKQASWDLYFRNNPVCQPPSGVEDPGRELSDFVGNLPLLILCKSLSTDGLADIVEKAKAIRSQSRQSWSNIRKAARALHGLEHEPFGTLNVERSAKACVRKMETATGLGFAEIEALLDEQGW